MIEKPSLSQVNGAEDLDQASDSKSEKKKLADQELNNFAIKEVSEKVTDFIDHAEDILRTFEEDKRHSSGEMLCFREDVHELFNELEVAFQVFLFQAQDGKFKNDKERKLAKRKVADMLTKLKKELKKNLSEIEMESYITDALNNQEKQGLTDDETRQWLKKRLKENQYSDIDIRSALKMLKEGADIANSPKEQDNDLTGSTRKQSKEDLNEVFHELEKIREEDEKKLSNEIKQDPRLVEFRNEFDMVMENFEGEGRAVLLENYLTRMKYEGFFDEELVQDIFDELDDIYSTKTKKKRGYSQIKEIKRFHRPFADATIARVARFKDLNAPSLNESDEVFKKKTRQLWKEFAVKGIVKYDEEQKKVLIINFSNLDGKCALGLFEMAHFDIEDVAYIMPDEYMPGRINLDVSDRYGLSIEDGGETVIASHFNPETGKESSATQIVYETLVREGLLKKEEHLDRLVEFVTQIENRSFPEQDKKFRDSYRTMLGMYRYMKFDQLMVYFRDKHKPDEILYDEKVKRDPKTGKDEKKVTKNMLRVYGLKIDKSKQFQDDIESSVSQIKILRQEGFIIDSHKYGKIVIEIGKQIKCGFDAVSAMDYDTIVSWDPAADGFFISSKMPIIDDFRQGKKLHGKMWIKPRITSGKLEMTLAELLDKMTDGDFKPEGGLKKFLIEEDLMIVLKKYAGNQEQKLIELKRICKQMENSGYDNQNVKDDVEKIIKKMEQAAGTPKDTAPVKPSTEPKTADKEGSGTDKKIDAQAESEEPLAEVNEPPGDREPQEAIQEVEPAQSTKLDEDFQEEHPQEITGSQNEDQNLGREYERIGESLEDQKIGQEEQITERHLYMEEESLRELYESGGNVRNHIDQMISLMCTNDRPDFLSSSILVGLSRESGLTQGEVANIYADQYNAIKKFAEKRARFGVEHEIDGSGQQDRNENILGRVSRRMRRFTTALFGPSLEKVKEEEKILRRQFLSPGSPIRKRLVASFIQDISQRARERAERGDVMQMEWQKAGRQKFAQIRIEQCPSNIITAINRTDTSGIEEIRVYDKKSNNTIILDIVRENRQVLNLDSFDRIELNKLTFWLVNQKKLPLGKPEKAAAFFTAAKRQNIKFEIDDLQKFLKEYL